MDTEKIYDQDAFLREFDAVVTECYEGKDGSCLVTLDRTAFYPEGGGQPADHGVLGGAAVLDVQEREGRVLHTCDRPLPVGRTVRGVIDWDRRFDHMQQHSGEHIVSGMLCAAFSCDNVGFHMGADTVIIDYNAPMTWEQVLEVEDRANRYIWENHLFRAYYPTPEELTVLPYRSKKAIERPVRITEFPGADRCACCGTHVAASGQVGLVKFLSCQKLRDGVRLELLCGGRAMEYLSRCWDQSRRISQALSVKPQAAFPAVQRLEEQLRQSRERCAALEEQVFRQTAEQYRNAGDVLLVQPDMEPDSVRRLCDAVSGTCGGRCAVFAGTGGSYRWAVIHPGQDLRAFIRDMNQALHSRGGGRDGFAQGSAACTEEELRAFFAQ